MTLNRRLLVAMALFGCAWTTSISAADALPTAPTELADNGGLQVRPAVIGFTGDGTGFLGGFTGRHSVPHPDRTALRWAGHLRWIEWTSTQARAHGAIWLNNGEPSDARGTFFPVAVTVRLFRPVGNVFTRLAMDYVFRGKATKDVRHARDFPPSEYTQGYWEW